MMRLSLLLTIGVVVGLASCESKQRPTIFAEGSKAEVVFREFGTLSYMPYGESQLEETNDYRAMLTDSAQLMMLSSALPDSCREIPHDGKELDLHLLVRVFAKDKLTATYRFSRFAYSVMPGESRCELTAEDRQRLEDVIRRLQRPAH